jgi:hypothetical protein
MAKIRELLARAFDVRALILLKPVYFFIALDVALTLLGQSTDYWSHFLPSGFLPDGLTLLKQYESYWRHAAVPGNEVALFGFGAYLLQSHPLFFFAGCAAYMVIAGVVVVSRIPGRTRLVAFQVFSLAHALAAFSWMDGIIKYIFRNIPKDSINPEAWIWLIGIVYIYFVASYLERVRAEYYARMNNPKGCDLPDCQ